MVADSAGLFCTASYADSWLKHAEAYTATVRLRTAAAKRFKKVDCAIVLIWKMLQVAEKTCRRSLPVYKTWKGSRRAVSQPEVAA